MAGFSGLPKFTRQLSELTRYAPQGSLKAPETFNSITEALTELLSHKSGFNLPIHATNPNALAATGNLFKDKTGAQNVSCQFGVNASIDLHFTLPKEEFEVIS